MLRQCLKKEVSESGQHPPKRRSLILVTFDGCMAKDGPLLFMELPVLEVERLAGCALTKKQTMQSMPRGKSI